MEPRARRQREQVHAARRDVLAHLPWRDGEARGPQLVVQLGVDQVDLPEVRPARVACHPRAMLHGRARMRVALDAEPGDETDALLGRLG